MMDNFIPASEGIVGKDYISMHGKRIQVVGKSGRKIKIIVLATDKHADVPINYPLFEPVEDEVNEDDQKGVAIEEELVEEPKPKKMRVDAKSVLNKNKPKNSEKKTTKNEKTKSKKKPSKNKSTIKKKPASKEEGGSKVMKKNDKKPKTAKQHVIDMLRKKVCSREELAKAIMSKNLTTATDVKKAKQFVSIMLANMKKKDKLNVVTVEPGKYRIEE